MKTEMKTAIILGVIIVGVVGGLSFAFTTLETSTQNVINVGDADGNKIQTQTFEKTFRYKKAPDLVGISHYINTTPEKLKEEIDGKVVLYDIWTYSCINCVRTLP